MNWVIKMPQTHTHTYDTHTHICAARTEYTYVRHKWHEWVRVIVMSRTESFTGHELGNRNNATYTHTCGTKSTHICEAPMGKSYLNVTNWVIYASRTGSFKRRELTSICAARVQHTYRRHEWAIVTYVLRTESFMRHELGHLNAANSHAYVRHELNTHMRGTNGQ